MQGVPSLAIGVASAIVANHAYVSWRRYAREHKDGRTYRRACMDLGYPADAEMVFDSNGVPYPHGWASVAGGSELPDVFGTTVDLDEPIPYALPVGPQEEWDTGPVRNDAFYRGRESLIRKFIYAGVSPEETGLVRLSAGELQILWNWVARLANLD